MLNVFVLLLVVFGFNAWPGEQPLDIRVPDGSIASMNAHSFLRLYQDSPVVQEAFSRFASNDTREIALPLKKARAVADLDWLLSQQIATVTDRAQLVNLVNSLHVLKAYGLMRHYFKNHFVINFAHDKTNIVVQNQEWGKYAPALQNFMEMHLYVSPMAQGITVYRTEKSRRELKEFFTKIEQDPPLDVVRSWMKVINQRSVISGVRKISDAHPLPVSQMVCNNDYSQVFLLKNNGVTSFLECYLLDDRDSCYNFFYSVDPIDEVRSLNQAIPICRQGINFKKLVIDELGLHEHNAFEGIAIDHFNPKELVFSLNEGSVCIGSDTSAYLFTVNHEGNFDHTLPNKSLVIPANTAKLRNMFACLNGFIGQLDNQSIIFSSPLESEKSRILFSLPPGNVLMGALEKPLGIVYSYPQYKKNHIFFVPLTNTLKYIPEALSSFELPSEFFYAHKNAIVVYCGDRIVSFGFNDRYLAALNALQEKDYTTLSSIYDDATLQERDLLG